MTHFQVPAAATAAALATSSRSSVARSRPAQGLPGPTGCCGYSGRLSASAAPASRRAFWIPRPATQAIIEPRKDRIAAAAAAGDDPAAGATHPPTFHDELTLIEVENEQLRETAGSLLNRQKVGLEAKARPFRSLQVHLQSLFPHSPLYLAAPVTLRTGHSHACSLRALSCWRCIWPIRTVSRHSATADVS